MTTVTFGRDIESAMHLRQAGFRATWGRVKLLEFLTKARDPLRVEAIAEGVKKDMDQASVYRALEAFVEKGLVRRVDLGHAHTHYEIAVGKGHPHALTSGFCATCICVS